MHDKKIKTELQKKRLHYLSMKVLISVLRIIIPNNEMNAKNNKVT